MHHISHGSGGEVGGVLLLERLGYRLLSSSDGDHVVMKQDVGSATFSCTMKS